jgi:hypothetical protein
LTPWEQPPERNLALGHRCYERRLVGVLRYDPPRGARRREWTACIELPEEYAREAREAFHERHGMRLEEPEFGFHMSVFLGPQDACTELSKLWGHLEGEKVEVLLTSELFWKGRCVWANAYCPEYFLLRETLCGLDCADPQRWGHATIGTFPQGKEFPPFLDYRDLPDWGFRP